VRFLQVLSALGCYNDRVVVKQRAQREHIKSKAADKAKS
jgi:hypothetical protein